MWTTWVLVFSSLLTLLVNGYTLRSTDNPSEDFVKPRYTHYEDLQKLFRSFVQKYPTLAKVHSIGKSVEGRDLLVLEISENVQERDLLKPMVKYVANMHGDEAVGRELLVYLAHHLLENYGKDPRVTNLVKTTDIFLMPSMNPDGFEKSQVIALFFIAPVKGYFLSNLIEKKSSFTLRLLNDIPILFAGGQMQFLEKLFWQRECQQRGSEQRLSRSI